MFFAGGCDALNDLKFVSGVESLSIYQMPKNQISGTKKILIFIFFVNLVLTFKVIQGHRSWCEIKAMLWFPIQG